MVCVAVILCGTSLTENTLPLQPSVKECEYGYRAKEGRDLIIVRGHRLELGSFAGVNADVIQLQAVNKLGQLDGSSIHSIPKVQFRAQ